MVKSWFLVFFTFFSLLFFTQNAAAKSRLTPTGEAFLREFLPEVRAVNQEIYMDRLLLRYWKAHFALKGWLPLRAYANLQKMAKHYGIPAHIPPAPRFKSTVWKGMLALTERVDIIPEEIVLAQAIVESGWGKSPSARRTKNFFGLTSRSQMGNPRVTADAFGAYYLKSYATMRDGIRDYAYTINTHWAYQDFRALRNSYRKAGEQLNPYTLTHGLLRWSERRGSYTAKLRMVIRRYLPQNMEAFLQNA